MVGSEEHPPAPSARPDEPASAPAAVASAGDEGQQDDTARPASTELKERAKESGRPSPRDVAQAAGERGPAHGLPRAVVVLLALAAGWITLGGAREIQDMLAPSLLAVTLVVTIFPLFDYQRRHKVPKLVAATTTLLSLYAVVGLLFFGLGYCVQQAAYQMPHYSSRLQQVWTQQQSAINDMLPGGMQIDQSKFGWDQVSPERVLNLSMTVLNSVMSGTSLLILALTVMFFLVYDSMNMGTRLDILSEQRPATVVGLRKFATGVRKYWVVTTVFGLIVAVLDYFALLAIGVPLALTWAIFSFVTNYIPNVGLVIGLLPPAGIALAEGGVADMLWVVGAYLALNTIVQTFIQPKFTGEAVGVTATVSFLSLVFWSYVLGPLGALLAVPMTLLVKSLMVDIDPSAHWLNALISDKPRVQPMRIPTTGRSKQVVTGG